LKPTRGLSDAWGNMSRDRRVALASLALLLALMGSLVMYEKWTQRPAEEPVQPMSQVPSFAQPANQTQTAGENPQVTAAPEPQAVAPKSLLEPLGKGRAVLMPYGIGHSEIYGDYRLHPGIDYQAKAGDPVVAAAAGKVVSIETDPAEGRVVAVDHGGGMVTRYGGLGKLQVTANTTVQAGTIIGQVGEPTQVKRSLGAHLHFEVLLGGSPEDPVSYFRP
jgi:murein DD-endopeptidase MepM/ murein hydrolase activator NlpD